MALEELKVVSWTALRLLDRRLYRLRSIVIDNAHSERIFLQEIERGAWENQFRVIVGDVWTGILITSSSKYVTSGGWAWGWVE